MPLLDKIVDEINNSLKSSLKAGPLQKSKLHGLAERYVKDTPDPGAAVAVAPIVFNQDGIGTPVEYQDGLAFTVYHRLLTNTYQADAKMQQGNDLGMICTSELIMVVCANRSIIKKPMHYLEAAIESAFPRVISSEVSKGVGLYKCLTALSSAQTDPLQVFATEYSNVSFFIKPHQSFFSFRYRVQSHYMPGCFKNCCDE